MIVLLMTTGQSRVHCQTISTPLCQFFIYQGGIPVVKNNNNSTIFKAELGGGVTRAALNTLVYIAEIHQELKF